MYSLQSLVWIILLTNRISAHAIPDQTATKESEIYIDGNTIQALLSKPDDLPIQSDLPRLIPSEAYREVQRAVENLYKDDPSTQLVKLAKRQADAGSSNSSIAVSTKVIITSTTELVTSFTTSSAAPSVPSPSSSPRVIQSPASTSTVAGPSPPSSSHSATLPPSTSVVVIPPSSSTTIHTVTTSPATVSVASANPAPSSSQPAVLPTQSSQASIIQSTSGSTPATSNGIQPLISATGTTPQSLSSAAESATQVPEAPGQASVVLVTSTLSNGQAVTLTSFVGASTPTSALAQGGTSTSPSGSVQSPSIGTSLHPWSFGAILASIGLFVAL